MAVESKTQDEVGQFHFALYRPDPSEKPSGFTEEDQLDAFAAFEEIAGGFK